MARFRGTVQGGRGVASRVGHKTTGLTLKATSHAGAIKVILRAIDNRDHAEIWLDMHEGKGQRKLVYSGPIDGDYRIGG